MGAVWQPLATALVGLTGVSLCVLSPEALRVGGPHGRGPRGSSLTAALKELCPSPAQDPSVMTNPGKPLGTVPKCWGFAVTGFAPGSSLVPTTAAKASHGVLVRGRDV